MDGVYHAYLMIPSDGYNAHVTAGWTIVDIFNSRTYKNANMVLLGSFASLSLCAMP